MSLKQLLVISTFSTSLLVPALASAQTASPCDLGSSPTAAQIQACLVQLQQQLAALQQQANQGQGLHDGDRVQTTVVLSVRSQPSTIGALITRVPVGSTGTIHCDLVNTPGGNGIIQNCPATANGYTWWYIRWDPTGTTNGGIAGTSAPVTGWSAEGNSEATFLVPPSGNGTGSTVTLTQSANTTTASGTTGQSFTVSWSSTNAASCTVKKTAPDGTLQNPWATGTSGSQSASPYKIGTHHWWVDCTGAGGTAHMDMFHTVTGGQASGVGTIQVRATLDGVIQRPLGADTISGDYTSPNGTTAGTSVVTGNYPNVPAGSHTSVYKSGGPAGATFQNLTIGGGASCGTGCGTLTAGGTLTFTFNFVTSTISLSSLNPASGAVGTGVTITGTGFTPTGNDVHFGSGGLKNLNATGGNFGNGTITFTVPTAVSACDFTNTAMCSSATVVNPGAYQVSVTNANGTSNAKTFTVTGGQTTGVGNGHIKATLNGAPWAGSFMVHFIHANGTAGDTTATPPMDFQNQLLGNYSFSYLSGGPTGATFQNITVSGGASCGTGCGTLAQGGDITFTFNFGTTTGGGAEFGLCYGPKYKVCVEAAGCGGPIITNQCGTTSVTCSQQATNACTNTGGGGRGDGGVVGCNCNTGVGCCTPGGAYACVSGDDFFQRLTGSCQVLSCAEGQALKQSCRPRPSSGVGAPCNSFNGTASISSQCGGSQYICTAQNVCALQ